MLYIISNTWWIQLHCAYSQTNFCPRCPAPGQQYTYQPIVPWLNPIQCYHALNGRGSQPLRYVFTVCITAQSDYYNVQAYRLLLQLAPSVDSSMVTASRHIAHLSYFDCWISCTRFAFFIRANICFNVWAPIEFCFRVAVLLMVFADLLPEDRCHSVSIYIMKFRCNHPFNYPIEVCNAKDMNLYFTI